MFNFSFQLLNIKLIEILFTLIRCSSTSSLSAVIVIELVHACCIFAIYPSHATHWCRKTLCTWPLNLTLRSRRESFLVQEIQHSFLTEQNFNNLVAFLVAKRFIIVATASHTYLAWSNILIAFEFGSLLRDFSSNIVNALAKHFLHKVSWLYFTSYQCFNIA